MGGTGGWGSIPLSTSTFDYWLAHERCLELGRGGEEDFVIELKSPPPLFTGTTTVRLKLAITSIGSPQEPIIIICHYYSEFSFPTRKYSFFSDRNGYQMEPCFKNPPVNKYSYQIISDEWSGKRSDRHVLVPATDSFSLCQLQLLFVPYNWPLIIIDQGN